MRRCSETSGGQTEGLGSFTQFSEHLVSTYMRLATVRGRADQGLRWKANPLGALCDIVVLILRSTLESPGGLLKNTDARALPQTT